MELSPVKLEVLKEMAQTKTTYESVETLDELKEIQADPNFALGIGDGCITLARLLLGLPTENRREWS
jgi:hypothetical protein